MSASPGPLADMFRQGPSCNGSASRAPSRPVRRKLTSVFESGHGAGFAAAKCGIAVRWRPVAAARTRKDRPSANWK